ncbi:hypothetical protein C0991_007544 [Blastosporella zonata]|nr:hypothetical protein C0991_007544 [Blastosporella zonata]
MDTSYPILPSLPSLISFLDGGYSGSEGSSPADSPTFHKSGESSRHSEVKPMFHPPPNSSYKMWRNDGIYDQEAYPTSYFPSSYQYPDPNHEMGTWDSAEEMDIDMLYGSGSAYDSDQHPTQHAGRHWPLWDGSASCSIPVSAARSSLQRLPPSQSAVQAFWRESPDDLFGPASPLSSTTSFHSGASYPSLPGLQPRNDHYDSIDSPYLYYSPASSQPAERTVSPPIACSISPALSSPSSLSSHSSPPSIPLSSCPPTPPTPVLLPELRQPRPGRPIPIVPLSELATACEQFYIPSPRNKTDFPKPKLSRRELKSSDQSSDLHFFSLPSKHPSYDSHHFYCGGNSEGSAVAYPYFDNGLGFHDSYKVNFT